MAKILIVEDEPLPAMELKELLINFGYTVCEICSSGDTVLENVIKHKPDCILMDINIKSFIDGIDVVNRIKLISKVKIIYITAYSSKEIKSRALLTNPSAFLVKPIHDNDLKRELEKALSGT